MGFCDRYCGQGVWFDSVLQVDTLFDHFHGLVYRGNRPRRDTHKKAGRRGRIEKADETRKREPLFANIKGRTVLIGKDVKDKEIRKILNTKDNQANQAIIAIPQIRRVLQETIDILFRLLQLSMYPDTVSFTVTCSRLFEGFSISRVDRVFQACLEF